MTGHISHNEIHNIHNAMHEMTITRIQSEYENKKSHCHCHWKHFFDLPCRPVRFQKMITVTIIYPGFVPFVFHSFIYLFILLRFLSSLLHCNFPSFISEKMFIKCFRFRKIFCCCYCCSCSVFYCLCC